MAKRDKDNGGNGEETIGGNALVPIPMGAPGGFGYGTAPVQFIASDVAKRNTKLSARIVQLKRPGDYVDGLLLGPGSGVEVEQHDKATGEVTRVNVATWNFDVDPKNPGKIVLGLMGNYQIDRELASKVGKRVRVTYLEMLDTRQGRRVKDCLIEEYIEAPEAA